MDVFKVVWQVADVVVCAEEVLSERILLRIAVVVIVVLFKGVYGSLSRGATARNVIPCAFSLTSLRSRAHPLKHPGSGFQFEMTALVWLADNERFA